MRSQVPCGRLNFLIISLTLRWAGSFVAAIERDILRSRCKDGFGAQARGNCLETFHVVQRQSGVSLKTLQSCYFYFNRVHSNGSCFRFVACGMDLKINNGEKRTNSAEQCFEMFPVTALNTNAALFFVEKVDQTDDSQLQWRVPLAYIRYVIHCTV